MCAGTVFFEDETEEADEMEHEIGLVPGHIYTLMAGYKIKINGTKQKIVKMRNPWGKHGIL